MNKNNILFFARRSKIVCAVAPFSDDKTLFRQIDNLINDGFEYFLFNADSPDGLRFAKQVLLRKKVVKNNRSDIIYLIAVTSDENTVNDKDEAFRDNFFDILSHCDDFIDIRNTNPYAVEKFIVSKSSRTT